MNAAHDLFAPDLERRFGGLRRLYGEAGYRRVRAARIAVVGLGGVGSWSVESLARSGVAALTLIDLDHVAESNINRQIQALGATLGASKGDALRQRIADINPSCEVHLVDDFVTPDNWPALLTQEIDVLIDACDQVHAKTAMAAWAIATGTPFITVGAAGGKRKPQAVEVEDLAATTHDPLLASLRQRLRKQHGAARSGSMGVRCVFSREAVTRPDASCSIEGESVDGSLNCAGYGSSVTVTATFGFVAAAEALQCVLRSVDG
jgi:tRNA A37 threonylcarbamoyladenosine dehydratase